MREPSVVKGCTLEVDHERGVLYIHDSRGMTLLRICSLPTPIPPPSEQLDITHMFGASWRGAPLSSLAAAVAAPLIDSSDGS